MTLHEHASDLTQVLSRYLDDPEEKENRAREGESKEMIELLRTALTAVEAPSEQFDRLGLG